MTTEPSSGIDLARQALIAARDAAKKNGATSKKPTRRTTAVVRRDGREPLGLGTAIGMMMTERGMAAPAAGGSGRVASKRRTFSVRIPAGVRHGQKIRLKEFGAHRGSTAERPETCTSPCM